MEIVMPYYNGKLAELVSVHDEPQLSGTNGRILKFVPVACVWANCFLFWDSIAADMWEVGDTSLLSLAALCVQWNISRAVTNIVN